MLYSSADLGGDGLAFDEEELWLGGSWLWGKLLVCGQERCIGLIALGGIDRKRGGCRCFDDGEGGYDGAIGVSDLCDEVS